MAGARSSGRRRVARRAALLAGLIGAAAPARAGTIDLFSPGTLSIAADLRVVAADGETSWTKGGFGKARFGGDGDGLAGRIAPTEAELIWQPRFGWGVGATVTAAVQRGGGADLIEAYASWKPVPRGPTRFAARAGLFWPPVSLEHEGPDWAVADMITPSAINSWIGEEVKVAGAEASVSRDVGSARVSATIAAFGYNDTAGTLIAFRGWALDDLKAGAFRWRPLPPLNPFMQQAQAPRTRPLTEIDHRPGFYARVSARLAAPVQLDAFYYRNRGEPDSVTRRLQWGWDTSFWNLGLRIDLGEHSRILAQALTGTTRMGIEQAGTYWVETRYRAAYLRFSTGRGPATLSGRLDLFGTRERGSEMGPDESEEGWALAADLAWTLSPHVRLLVEGLHLDSDRTARARVGLSPLQRQNIVQTSMRIRL